MVDGPATWELGSEVPEWVLGIISVCWQMEYKMAHRLFAIVRMPRSKVVAS